MIHTIITATAPFYEVCVKIDYKGYEISISSDASCKANEKTLTRTELRVFKGPKDVTNEICGHGVYFPNLDDLWAIKNKIDEIREAQHDEKARYG